MYIQTWQYVCKLKKRKILKWLYHTIQWICEKAGHEYSKTEWGYGGGEFGDVWCRWCNKMGKMPLKELDSKFPNARTAIWKNTYCDIKHEQWNPDE